jgi:hypothetical protein
MKIISIKNYYELFESDEICLIEEIFCSKEIYDNQQNSYGVYSNFKLLKDTKKITENIYEKFLKTSEKIFGDLILNQNNSRSCFCLCTNKNYWASVPHDHIRTSTINSVFYLRIPKINNQYCGKILFYDENVWKSYQPEPYEFLIMPNYLVHDTEFHETDEWRISLNFEIKTDNAIDWNMLNDINLGDNTKIIEL